MNGEPISRTAGTTEVTADSAPAGRATNRVTVTLINAAPAPRASTACAPTCGPGIERAGGLAARSCRVSVVKAGVQAGWAFGSGTG